MDTLRTADVKFPRDFVHQTLLKQLQSATTIRVITTAKKVVCR